MNRHFVEITIALTVTQLVAVAGFAIESNKCEYQLVETMPDKFTYQRQLPFELAKTHEVFLDLINKAKKKIQVASFYLSLLPENEEEASHPSAEPGRLVLEALESAARDRHVQVEVVIGKDEPSWSNPIDLERLRAAGVDLKVFNVTKLTGGVMHTKMISIDSPMDSSSFYLGSANFDWRALSQVKEFGIVFYKCPTLAKDLEKIFKTYQLLSGLESVPTSVPQELTTSINKNNPFLLMMDNIETQVYMGASPPMFNGENNQRSTDLEALLETIEKAQKFIYISVMNYSPVEGWRKKKFWPIIENALKSAVYERRVQVKMLIAKTDKPFKDDELAWYKSLNALNNSGKYAGGIEVRFFTVTANDEFQAKLKHARLNHQKFIVSESSVFVGTSNFQPSYFTDTCGVGLSIRPKKQQDEGGRNILSDMKMIFEKDFFSEHSSPPCERDESKITH